MYLLCKAYGVGVLCKASMASMPTTLTEKMKLYSLNLYKSFDILWQLNVPDKKSKEKDLFSIQFLSGHFFIDKGIILFDIFQFNAESWLSSKIMFWHIGLQCVQIDMANLYPAKYYVGALYQF